VFKEIATFLTFFVSLGNTARFLRIGEKSYIYILDNPLLFPTVKIISKSFTVDEGIAKMRHHVFETQYSTM